MITTKENIIQYFQRGIKNKNNLKIGVEHEKFIFNKLRKRVNYQTINKIFDLFKNFGWHPIFEGNDIIALKKNDQQITLEPGNQIELSGAKLNNIHEICKEAHDYIFELKQIISKLNLRIISLGFDPISKLNEIPGNPKKRYEIMTKEMPKNGRLSLDMMYRTCGTQINLDYCSEEDFTKKFKLSCYLVPLSMALFANSSIVEKKNSNYYSYRSKVWQETSRGGLPVEFLDNMDFEKYAKFIMKIPILFAQRKNNYIEVNGKNFEDFMNGRLGEINNELPDENDLSNHLGTIFTENRLKQYIEIRSIDTCDWDCLCNAPAFYVGLLYGNLEESLEIVSKWNKKNLLNAYIEAPKKGLRTELEGKNIGEWNKIFFNLAKKGLEKRNQLNKSKKNETIYLNYINQILNSNKTNAELILSKFQEDKDLNYLYEN